MNQIEDSQYDIPAKVVRPLTSASRVCYKHLSKDPFAIVTEIPTSPSMSQQGNKRSPVNTSFIITIVRPSWTRCCNTGQHLLATYRESAFHLMTPSTLGQGDVYSYAQINGMRFKQTRREKKGVSERLEATKYLQIRAESMVGEVG